MNTLTLEFQGEEFIVDSFMCIYYNPYSGSDDWYKFHVSELNNSHYHRLYKELIQFQQNVGLTPSLNYEQFLSICERLFEMHCILRKM